MAGRADGRRCPRCGSRTAQLAHTCLLCGAPLPEERDLSGVVVLFVATFVVSVSLMAMRRGAIRAARAEATSPARPVVVAQAPSPTEAPPVMLRPPPSATRTASPAATEPPSSPSVEIPLGPTPTAAVGASERAGAGPTSEVTLVGEAEGPELYQVQHGDYWLSVAQRYGVELQALLALNPGMDSGSQLYVGQSIRVPAPGAAAGPTAAFAQMPVLPATLAPTTTPMLPLSDQPGCYRLINRDSEWATVTLFSLQVAWQDVVSLEPGGEWRYCLMPGQFGYSIAVPGEASPRTGRLDVRGGEDQEWPLS